jgi:hypothetical protein
MHYFRISPVCNYHNLTCVIAFSHSSSFLNINAFLHSVPAQTEYVLNKYCAGVECRVPQQIPHLLIDAALNSVCLTCEFVKSSPLNRLCLALFARYCGHILLLLLFFSSTPTPLLRLFNKLLSNLLC